MRKKTHMGGMIFRCLFLFLCGAVCFLLFAGILPVRGAVAESPVFHAHSFTLDNGIRLVVVPNGRAPVVTHMVWYGVGSADEPAGDSGIAHFLEHMMFKGTPRYEAGVFSRTVRGLGGTDNAFTGYDFTSYHQSLSTDHLRTVMDMESDRMRNVLLPQAEIDSERLVIMEERRQRTDNNPQARFREHLRALLFVNHPYGRPVIGWMAEIETLDREALLDVYRTWYAPENALVIVSGDVEPVAVRDMAQETWGQIPSHGGVPVRVRPASPPLSGDVFLTRRESDVRQPVIARLYRVPSFAQSPRESLALQVMAEIVDGDPSARLYRTLVAQEALATGVSFFYDSQALDDGMISVSITPADGKDPQDVLSAFDAVVADIARAGVSQEELANAVSRLQAAAVYARDSLTGPAMIIGRALMTGSTIEDVETWPAQIASVRAEDVQDAARRWIVDNSHGRVSGVLLPAPVPEQTEGSTP